MRNWVGNPGKLEWDVEILVALLGILFLGILHVIHGESCLHVASHCHKAEMCKINSPFPGCLVAVVVEQAVHA